MLYNFFTKNGNLTFFPSPRAFSWGLALVPGLGLVRVVTVRSDYPRDPVQDSRLFLGTVLVLGCGPRSWMLDLIWI